MECVKEITHVWMAKGVHDQGQMAVSPDHEFLHRLRIAEVVVPFISRTLQQKETDLPARGVTRLVTIVMTSGDARWRTVVRYRLRQGCSGSKYSSTIFASSVKQCRYVVTRMLRQ